MTSRQRREAFEAWYTAQFPTHTEYLARRAGGTYDMTEVNAMFIGFCAGTRVAT